MVSFSTAKKDSNKYKSLNNAYVRRIDKTEADITATQFLSEYHYYPCALAHCLVAPRYASHLPSLCHFLRDSCSIGPVTRDPPNTVPNLFFSTSFFIVCSSETNGALLSRLFIVGTDSTLQISYVWARGPTA